MMMTKSTTDHSISLRSTRRLLDYYWIANPSTVLPFYAKEFFCELSLYKAVEANWIVINVGVKFMLIMKIILAHRSMQNKKNTKNCHKISKCIQIQNSKCHSPAEQNLKNAPNQIIRGVNPIWKRLKKSSQISFVFVPKRLR